MLYGAILVVHIASVCRRVLLGMKYAPIVKRRLGSESRESGELLCRAVGSRYGADKVPAMTVTTPCGTVKHVRVIPSVR